MMDDRNYYRQLDDEELIELAKSIKTSELAIVLAERLKREKDTKWRDDQRYKSPELLP